MKSKIRLPDCKVIEKMNRLGLKKYQPKEKEIGLWID